MSVSDRVEEASLPTARRARSLEAEDLGLAVEEDPSPLSAEEVENVAEEFDRPLEEVQQWVDSLRYKRQIIIYGPPGTGKTHLAKKLAGHIVSGTDGFQETVQFHPTYSYEDFIHGIRPQVTDEGDLVYGWEDGGFVSFCDEARDRADDCVLVIDEVNRANISEVFGELLFLLEHRDSELRLSGGRRFTVPENVLIIGTMNTADKSIALLDYAFRRRFSFVPLWPDYDLLRSFHARETGLDVEGLVEVLEEINDAIDNRHKEVGITYFLTPDLGSRIEAIWRTEIEPYLEEYFFDEPERVSPFRWAEVEGRIGL